MGNKIYIYTKTNEKNRRKIVLWRADEWAMYYHLASFDNVEQLEKFLCMFGVEYKHIETINENDPEHEIKVYETNFTILDHFSGGYWDSKQLPKKAVKFKALSNGSIVDCYFKKYKRGKKIYIYRPNPNAKEVYKPLATPEHIAFQTLYGIY